MVGYYMRLITQVQLQLNMTRPGKTGLIYAQNDFGSIKGNKFLSVIHIVSKILSYMHISMKNSIELTEWIAHMHRTGDTCHKMNKCFLCR